MSDVTILDYGLGNTKSVLRAFESLGVRARLCADPDQVRQAERLVLPGVGAFGDGMATLHGLNLVEALKAFVATGRPLLGICLGMQMLLERGEEHGRHDGMGLIPGVVRQIPPARDAAGMPCKVPHVGWAALACPAARAGWAGTLLAGVGVEDAFYFVHSFAAFPEQPSDVLAQVRYGDLSLTAAVARDNVVGVQFHPEKSGATGIALLRAFVGTST